MDLPGTAAATPVAWENHVFISSTDKRTRSTVAMAVDRKTGKVLWQHAVGAGDSRDERSNFAVPTPATDGKLVVYFTEMVIWPPSISPVRNFGSAICKKTTVFLRFNGRFPPALCSLRANCICRSSNGTSR